LTDPRSSNRVLWLDGIRGAAATFVVLHHIWLTTWPGFPTNTGPWWLGWLLYGHMAVAVFIVVSGFSLALVPLHNGESLPGGVGRFVQRRAWRILPAYWAALVVSVIVTALLLQPDLGAGAVGKGFVVHGLLLQDVIGSQSPNGAFWSIAIEWQIYFVFPLILLLARWTSLGKAVLLTALAVLAAHFVAGMGGPFEKIDGLTPQFLALFALGVLAVRLGSENLTATHRRGLGTLAAAAFVAFAFLAATQGSEWMVARFFWMDLLFGLGVACALAVMYSGGSAPARSLLTSPGALWLGLFSYSIYLVHAPIVGILDKYGFGAMGLPPLAAFGLMLAVGLPLILGLCYAFHLAFEAPFLRNRSLGALRTMPFLRLFPRIGLPPAEAGPVPAEDASARPIVPAPRPAAGRQSAG
jgi:peptidoglycan/LPS O-acetylase OafA/YrhL